MALTLMENFRSVKQANSESVFQVSIFYRQMGHPIIGIGADVNECCLFICPAYVLLRAADGASFQIVFLLLS